MISVKGFFILIILSVLVLTGCSQGEDDIKGESDIRGKITEVDTEGNRVLVEDDSKGLIWVSLPKESDAGSFEMGDTVAVWTDGQLRESYPMQATGLNIEKITTQ